MALRSTFAGNRPVNVVITAEHAPTIDVCGATARVE
jgi:hypothetical protein